MAVTEIPTSAAMFVAQVETIFHQYWGGHYEVVKTFFGQPRPQEQLLKWLDLQLYKEIHVVPVKARQLIEMYEKLDGEIDRGEYEAEAYEMADEVQHYRLLADIMEMITGKRRPALEFKATAEQSDLEAKRRQYANAAPLVRSVGGFNPGGGTAFGAAGAMIDGGPVQRQLADAFKVIYRQELEHYNKNRFIFDRRALEAEPQDYSEALTYAQELARSHFLMRNASFSHPLSPARVAEIDAGNVTPYVPPRLY
ncbi:MAG: hypothetical protein HW416_473 [Chloroflexi bacterium]|nr:hypothetical protein [Chloroflexota bacterium]